MADKKAGSMTLSKNKKKVKETHPDYTGCGIDLEGDPIWVSAWIKKGNYGTFLSLSIKKKDESENKHKSNTVDSDLDDDIPF